MHLPLGFLFSNSFQRGLYDLHHNYLFLFDTFNQSSYSKFCWDVTQGYALMPLALASTNGVLLDNEYAIPYSAISGPMFRKKRQVGVTPVKADCKNF